MRKPFLLLLISGMLACCLAMLTLSVLTSASPRALALSRITPTTTVTPQETPSPLLPSPAPCIKIEISNCSASIATDNPANYTYSQGSTIHIQGQRWTTNATIELFVLPTASIIAAQGSDMHCPTPTVLTTRSVAHSAQKTTGANGDFSIQLTLPTTLNAAVSYSACISETSAGHITSILLFQITVNANTQQQTGTTAASGRAAPFYLNLSMIALVLALIALLLYFIAPRQPATPHTSERRNVV